MIDHYLLFATLRAKHQLKERDARKSLAEVPRFSPSSSEVIECERNLETPVDWNTKNKK